MPLSDYAALYGRSLRTLKRWAKAGAPLDDADAMTVWLNDSNLAPVRKTAPTHPATPAPEPKTAPVVTPAPETEQASSPIALESNLRNLRERVATVEAHYRDALESGVERDIRFWRQETVEVLDQLRRLEVAWTELAVSQREMITMGEAEEVISPIVRLFNGLLQSLPQRVAPELVGLNQDEMRGRLGLEINDIAESLHKHEAEVIEYFITRGKNGGIEEAQDDGIT